MVEGWESAREGKEEMELNFESGRLIDLFVPGARWVLVVEGKIEVRVKGG